MARINLSRYTLEFYTNLPGHCTYTWFVSRRNYGKSSLVTSYTFWEFSTDNISFYHALCCTNIDRCTIIKLIKSFPTVKKYKVPYEDPYFAEMFGKE